MLHLITDLSILGKVSLTNIFNELLLDNTKISVYETTRVYNTGEMILHFNTNTNNYELLEAVQDGVTGVYDNLMWQNKSPLFQPDGSIDLGTF